MRDNWLRTLLKSSLISFLVLLCCSAGLSAGSTLPGYPDHYNDYVNDFAHVLNERDRNDIENIFKKLEYQTGIEAVVVTIESVSTYGTNDYNIESFATNLFNTWGIGHKKSNDGVLLLVAVNDRKVRIELGGSYAHRYDNKMKRIIEDVIIPKFKSNEMSLGIFLGSKAIEKEITVPIFWAEFYKWHLLIAGAIVALILSGIFFERRGKRGLVWLCFGGAFYLLFALIGMLISGKTERGFGGGSSGGGGATGSW